MPKRAVTTSRTTLTFDARPDRLDVRDRPYNPPVASLDAVYPPEQEIKQHFPLYAEAKLVLDQGEEGACTGFGLACVINFLLWKRSGFALRESEQVSPRMLYQLARFYDEWPGEDYEGSSCRGALKGWHRHGVCAKSFWPKSTAIERPKKDWAEDALTRPLGVYYRIERQSVVDIQAAIYHNGAVYVSANVHNGWQLSRCQAKEISHKTLPDIPYGSNSKINGGHAFALVGYNERGFIVQNSWGDEWGASGFAVMSYADWVENGCDAWVVSLGAPIKQQGNTRSRTQARPYFIQGNLISGLFRNPLADKANIWTEQEAYWHTLVTGNDGNIINRLPHVADAADNAKFVCFEQPKEWFEKNQQHPPRIAIFAHGGLNSESASIERIRVLGQTFKANGIYPIFTTWRSGWQETIAQMIQDNTSKLFGEQPSRGLGDFAAESWDRMVELACRNLLVKSMWSEMKENVARGMQSGRGLDAIAQQLQALKKVVKGELEIHLVGHSAGSFVCGRLLKELQEHNLKADSCTLLAPACDLEFALAHYKPAIESNTLSRNHFHIHALTDKNELDDSVGPYRKSLLYLVSRALERLHKTPLLGMSTAFDAQYANGEFWHSECVNSVRQWQQFFWNGNAPQDIANSKYHSAALTLLDAAQINNGRHKSKSTHGCFDNDLNSMNALLGYILSGKVTQPFNDLDY